MPQPLGTSAQVSSGTAVSAVAVNALAEGCNQPSTRFRQAVCYRRPLACRGYAPKQLSKVPEHLNELNESKLVLCCQLPVDRLACRGLVDTHLQTDSLVRTARLRSPHSSTACVTHCNRQLQHTSNQHVQSSASSVEHDVSSTEINAVTAHFTKNSCMVSTNLQAQHRQSGPSAADHLAWALRLPSLYVVRDSHQASAGMASGSLSAINQYTGQPSAYPSLCL